MSAIALDRHQTRSQASPETQWPVILPVLLMVVSDFDVRQRPVTESLAGRPDLAVLFEVAVYAAAGVLLLNVYFQHPSRVRAAPALVALWGFGVTMVVSAALAPFPLMGLVRGAQLLVMCLLAAVLSSAVTRDHVSDTVHMFVAIVAAAVAFGVVFPYPHVSKGTADRFTWLYVHPTVSGTYLAIALVILIALSVRPVGELRWPRGAYIALAGVIAIALARNLTRGSIAAAIAGAVVVAIVSSSRRQRAGRVLAVAAAAVFIVIVFGGALLQYLSRGETTENLSTLNSRTDLWDVAWDFFSQRPVSGWGLGATRGLFLQRLDLGGGHNAFVNVLVDGGIAGLVWWLATLVCVIAAARKLARVPGWRIEVPIVAGILATILVNSLTVEGLGSVANVSSMWLVVLIGWCVAGVREGYSRPEAQFGAGKRRDTGLQIALERVSSRSVGGTLTQ